MLKYSEIEKVFLDNGVNVVEYNVETIETIEPPIIVYSVMEGESFLADSINYLKMWSVSLAIVDQDYNFELQRKIEKVLDTNNTMFDKSINFDEEWRFYTISYTFSVLDDVDDKD